MSERPKIRTLALAFAFAVSGCGGLGSADDGPPRASAGAPLRWALDLRCGEPTLVARAGPRALVVDDYLAVFALDATSAAPIWRVERERYGGRTVVAPGGDLVAIADRHDRVGGVDGASAPEGTLRVLETATGKPLWTLAGAFDPLDFAGGTLIAESEAGPHLAGKGGLAAFDARTGARRWAVDGWIPLEVRAVPDAGLVAVTRLVRREETRPSADYETMRAYDLVADGLDLATGRARWSAVLGRIELPEKIQYSGGPEPDERRHVRAAGGDILRRDGATLICYVAQPRRAAIALDLATGKERWRSTWDPSAPAPDGHMGWAPFFRPEVIACPALEALAFVVPDEGTPPSDLRTRIEVVRAADGKPIRTLHFAQEVSAATVHLGSACAVAVDGSDLYVSRPGRLEAVDLRTGARRFEVKGGTDWLRAPLVTPGGGLIAFHADEGRGRVTALDRKSGAARWSYRAPPAGKIEMKTRAGNSHVGGWPAIFGRERTITQFAEGFLAAPLVRGDLVYVPVTSHLVALDVASGEARFTIEAKYPASAPGLWDAGDVILYSYGGRLHALEPAAAAVTPGR